MGTIFSEIEAQILGIERDTLSLTAKYDQLAADLFAIGSAINGLRVRHAKLKVMTMAVLKKSGHVSAPAPEVARASTGPLSDAGPVSDESAIAKAESDELDDDESTFEGHSP